MCPFKTPEIISNDLCSGGGIPYSKMACKLQPSASVILKVNCSEMTLQNMIKMFTFLFGRF